MTDPKTLLCITGVYLLSVLILPILRGRQPLLPWLICTVFQVGAIQHFKDCSRLIEGFLAVHPVIFGFKLQTTDKDLLFFTAVFCLAINVMLILALNRIIMGLQIMKDTKKRVKRLKERALQQEAQIRQAEDSKNYDEQLKAAADRMKADLKRRGFDYIETKPSERG